MLTASYVMTDPLALILGSVAAVTGAFVCIRWHRSSTRVVAAVWGVVGALVASSLAAAPVTAWDIVRDTRANARLSVRATERFGAEENHYDTSLTDRARAIIPRDETYWLAYANTIDPARAQVFLFWSLPGMLPRKAVPSVRTADWIVSWGVSPMALGVKVDEVHVVRPSNGSDPRLYVARIAR